MNEPSDSSLIQEYRREFSSGFHPLQLWRDRRRILAEPAIAAQPNPSLANAPVRFALSLQLIPILFIGWAVSAMIGFAAPKDARVSLYGDNRQQPVIEVLQAQLPGMTDAELKRIDRSIRVGQMTPAAQDLAEQAARKFTSLDTVLVPNDNLPAEDVRAFAEDWVQQVHAATLSKAQQRTLIAKVLGRAQAAAKSAQVLDGATRNVSEGGVIQQVLGAIILLLGAWLFGVLLRRDTRFINATRADRFYLYYSSSRMFWFLIVGTLVSGVVSYASAMGQAPLLHDAILASGAINAAAFVWLLLHAREMARALGAGDPLPSGAGLSVAWRIVVATLAMGLALTIGGMLIGIAIAKFPILIGV